MGSLVFHRRHIVQRRMSPLLVIKHFDVFKQIPPRLRSGLIATMVRQFRLQRMKETLHRRIIQTVPFPAHAALQAIRVQ